MKKGLLSLLALALTVVGCQNYDDQFAELTELIEGVRADVEDLSALQSSVNALSTTLENLEGTLTNDIDAVSDAVAELAGNVDGNASTLSTLQDALQAVADQVADIEENGATQAQITALNAELDAIDADLDELLEANAVINQDITIKNDATLEYAESLVSTNPNDPAVVVKGKVTVVSTFANSSSDKTDRINAVTNRIKTILGNTAGEGLSVTHSASSTVNFNELTFVDANVDINTAFTLPKLITISGTYRPNFDGAVLAGALSEVGTTTINKNITELNLSGVTVNGALHTVGEANKTINAPKATMVNAGTAVVTKVTAPKASQVIATGKIAADGDITITAAKATNITVGVTSVNLGVLTISGSSTTDISLPNVTSLATTTINAAEHKSLDMPKLTSIIGSTATPTTFSLDAKAITISALKTSKATMTLNGAATLNLPAYSLTTTFTADDATTLVVDNVTQNEEGVNLFTAGKLESLTIENLGAKNTVSINAQLPKLETAVITGKKTSDTVSTTSQSNLVSITAGAADLESVTINGYVDTVSSTNAKMETLITGGQIRMFGVVGSDDLETATIEHDHINQSAQAEVHFVDNDDVSSLTFTNLDETGNIEIRGNAKLANLRFPALDTKINTDSFQVTITDNKLGGTYVSRTASTATSDAAEAVLKSDDLLDIISYLKLWTTNTPTFAFDLAAVASATQDDAGVMGTATSYTTSLSAIILENEGYDNNTPSALVTNVEAGATGASSAMVSNTYSSHYLFDKIVGE